MSRTEMPRAEAIMMMERCAQEIAGLRRQVEILMPKAEAYDNLTAVLRLLPQPPRACGEDLVHVIRKRMEEMRRVENEA